MMKRLMITAALVLGACAQTPIDPRVEAESKVPLTCHDKATCDHYWQRAQAFVAMVSAYRIQTATDTLIITYGPFGSKVDLAYRIIRDVNANGSARIRMDARCDNFIRCHPTPAEAFVAFKAYVQQK